MIHQCNIQMKPASPDSWHRVKQVWMKLTLEGIQPKCQSVQLDSLPPSRPEWEQEWLQLKDIICRHLQPSFVLLDSKLFLFFFCSFTPALRHCSSLARWKAKAHRGQTVIGSNKPLPKVVRWCTVTTNIKASTIITQLCEQKYTSEVALTPLLCF